VNFELLHAKQASSSSIKSLKSQIGKCEATDRAVSNKTSSREKFQFFVLSGGARTKIHLKFNDIGGN